MVEEKPSQTKEVKLLKPKNDFVFQSLFNQNNEKITKAFVQALLDEKIQKIVINDDKELFREKPEDKLGVLDLQLDINNKEKVDVEIQLIEREDFVERLLFYLSRLYQGQIKRGMDYSEAKRIVLIAILDYKLDITKGIKEIETKWNLLEKNHPKLELTKLIEIRILELEKVKEYYRVNKKNKKVQWLMFLNEPNSKEVEEIMEENEEIKEAVIEVHKMSEDEKMQRLEFLKEKAIMDEKSSYRTGLHKGIRDGLKQGIEKGIEQGMKQGMKQGVKQGVKQEKIEIAKRMLEKGMNLNSIMEITGLSKEEIEKIKLN